MKFFSRNKAALQKWIGNAGVKSLPVIFYAQKNSKFSNTLRFGQKIFGRMQQKLFV